MYIQMWAVLSDEEYKAYFEDGFIDSTFLFAEYDYAVESQEQVGGNVYSVELLIESVQICN